MFRLRLRRQVGQRLECLPILAIMLIHFIHLTLSREQSVGQPPTINFCDFPFFWHGKRTRLRLPFRPWQGQSQPQWLLLAAGRPVRTHRPPMRRIELPQSHFQVNHSSTPSKKIRLLAGLNPLPRGHSLQISSTTHCRPRESLIATRYGSHSFG